MTESSARRAPWRSPGNTRSGVGSKSGDETLAAPGGHVFVSGKVWIIVGSAWAVGFMFQAVWLLLAIPSGVCLVLGHGKTRMSGFLWLLVSVVVWPWVARTLSMAIGMEAPSLMASRGWTPLEYSHMLTAVSLGEALVGGVLLLVSCLVLYREVVARWASSREPGTASPNQPTYSDPSV